MSKLEQLIEWMKEEARRLGDIEEPSIEVNIAFDYLSDHILPKAKQLQKEEPKTYTQEQMRIAYNSESDLPFSEWISKYF